MDKVISRRVAAALGKADRKKLEERNAKTATSLIVHLTRMLRLLAITMAFILPSVAARAQGQPELTLIAIGAPANTKLGEFLTIQAVLVDGRGNPISRAVIYFTTTATFLSSEGDVVLAQAITTVNGQAVAQFVDNFSGTITLRAEYRGDAKYAPSKAETTIAVVGEEQVYVEHIGVDIPGLNVPPVLGPMASIRSPVQSIWQFPVKLWPAMNGWPIAAALIVVWSSYFMAVLFVFRIALSSDQRSSL